MLRLDDTLIVVQEFLQLDHRGHFLIVFMAHFVSRVLRENSELPHFLVKALHELAKLFKVDSEFLNNVP